MSYFIFHELSLFYHSSTAESYQCVHIDDSVNVNLLLREEEVTKYIFINSARFTLVPNAIFLASQVNEYYKLNFGETISNERVYFSINNAFDVSNIFGISKEVDKFRQSLEKPLIIEHFSQLLLRYAKNSGLEDQPLLVITPCSSYFLLKEAQKLLQLSTGEFDNESDVIYFLLAHLKSMEIKKIENLSICLLNEVSNFSIHEFENLLKGVSTLSQTTIHYIEPIHLFSAL
ncbi:MAG: DUF3822 family protein [Bacteroidetes bacterium]|nr:DUF3822 family protein [Bacteroidota bacterium]